MRLHLKLGGVAMAALAVTAYAGIAAVPAAAEGPEGAVVSDVIVYQGCTTSLVPAVALLGGGGTYGFDTTTGKCGPAAALGKRCAGYSDGAETTLACTLSASGTYSNIVCGTGSTGGGALGAHTDTATVVEDATESDTVAFGITFVAGIGVVSGTVTASTETPDNDVNGRVAGAVQITPTAGNCVVGVSQFAATGAAIVLEP